MKTGISRLSREVYDTSAPLVEGSGHEIVSGKVQLKSDARA